uniref:hypothetical protein n=1 Tax=Streptomyces cellulosae TaxID=1968 RepID=UPI002F9137C1
MRRRSTRRQRRPREEAVVQGLVLSPGAETARLRASAPGRLLSGQDVAGVSYWTRPADG